MKTAIQQFFSTKYWLEATDNVSLVVFRAIFGFLLTCEAWGAISTGWVYKALIAPDFTFNFIGFEFLQPLAGNGMYLYFFVMGLAGFCVMLGWRYKWAMLTYAILWTGVYLMQKTHYNNHYYMAMLLCWVMLFLPANRAFSIDARQNPSIKTDTCPRWCLLILMVQLGLVYIYASIAKMHWDWIQGLPIGIWFKNKTDYPLIGWIYGLDMVKWGVVWGGILFDLLIIPLLLWKPSRKIAFSISLFFHIFNSITFQIGIFPFMMIGFSVFFFEPQTVREAFYLPPRNLTNQAKISNNIRYKKWVLIPVYGYLLVQLLLPLRHWYFPGNVHWTEEGHRLSWHMMLRSKWGTVYFKVINPTTKETTNIVARDYMTKSQVRAMAKRPDMIWQFAQRLKKMYAEKGEPNVEIYAIAKGSLNGRKKQSLVDDSVDLAKEPWHHFQAKHWIVPLEIKLYRKATH